MKNFYNYLETKFERFSEIALSVFGNAITFIIIFILVSTWIVHTFTIAEDFHELFRDILLGFSFISFFIIQKSFNRYSKSIHVKLNELVFSHENASNNLVNAEKKTEAELEAINRQYENPES